MKKILVYIFCLSLIGFSCTKDCCYEGTEITEEEALKIIDENEAEDSLFAAVINGELKCLNDEPMMGLSIKIRDGFGFESDLESDEKGNFVIPLLSKGNYTLKFSNPYHPVYTLNEWDDIYKRLDSIVLGSIIGNNIDKLAYDLANYGDLTTLDKTYFDKLRKGEITIETIEFPWRYVLTDKLNQIQIISDSIVINLETAQDLDLRITPIYIGDTSGQFCN